ncbi:sn-glycerol-3-phosphate ABC transporter ATP-binding protein UgpC [Okeanomitos corallinicola TIOX110]|uniref:Sn-glycerol-3-phosphate ABC transporter ATP-binding protein UgpC n=1 Tax=Okeanomitos corallinicola TIOX110 TaxID=3133117 RepID=A0ABZ2ULX1_9CYAN
MATIEFQQIFKVYSNGYTALKNLSLDIKDGEFLVFVGPSGCGKSTALRMLAGLEEISGGKLLIGGEIVNDKTPQERNIAMVFQNYALYPHMTVRENMEFPLKMLKMPKAERQKRVIAAAEKLGLTNLLDNKPKQMSGGQRQRVAMGRAIVRNPSVFLMDEPLSNLDAKMRVQIRTEISQLQRNMGITMVYVTHDQVEAMTMGDRVAVMKGGELQQIAPPQELYDSPANTFVAAFIGSPAMNIFRSKLIKNEMGDLIINFGNQPLVIDPETINRYQQLENYLNQEILVGLRPEAFAYGDKISQGHNIEVDIETVESLGHEMIIYFHAGVDKIEVAENRDGGSEIGTNKEENPQDSSLLIARVATAQEILGKSKITLTVDTKKLYFFDQDGEAII